MAKVLLKPKGWPTSRLNRLGVFGLDLVVNLLGIAGRLLFQDCGQGGAGVFGIDVDASAEDGLMADVASGQVEAALDREMSFVFDLLGNDFAEDELFGEILGADDDAILARRAARGEKKERENGGKESAIWMIGCTHSFGK